MKTKIFILTVCLSVLLIGCKDNTNAPSTGGGDYIPDAQLAIIKTTPELLEQVFASPIVDSVFRNTSGDTYTLYYGDSLVLYNSNITDNELAGFAQTQLQLLGTSPYILLDGDYAIIDWRWTHFHPLSGELRNVRNCYSNPKTNMVSWYSTHFPSSRNLLKNEEYYLLHIRWNELKELNTTWEMKDGQSIEKPQLYYVNFDDIENYGKLTLSGKDLPLLDLKSIYDLYCTDEVSYRSCLEKMDMLQSSYVETLNQMIKNKDFDTWKQF